VNRSGFALALFAVLGLAIALYARSHSPDDVLNTVKGIRIVSRIPCDGSTNPREEVDLHPVFSPGGWQRSFHLDMFQSKYCRRLDLYYICVFHGHDGWRPEWSAGSASPVSAERFWLKSCSAWESSDAAQYLLSGWYKEGAPAEKLPWKQAAVRQVSSNPAAYEFTDPNGGTARLELRRK
jgi:hypothetical protein